MTMMPPSTVVDLFAPFFVCGWTLCSHWYRGCAASWREIAMQSLKLASRGSWVIWGPRCMGFTCVYYTVTLYILYKETCVHIVFDYV